MTDPNQHNNLATRYQSSFATPHAKTGDEILSALNASPHGLAHSEAISRMAQFGDAERVVILMGSGAEITHNRLFAAGVGILETSSGPVT